MNPIEDVAAFLRSADPTTCRAGTGQVRVVDCGHRRELDVAIEVSQEELSVVATKENWGEIYVCMSQLVRRHRMTHIFVNTRRLCERVAHHLEERLRKAGLLFCAI